MSLVQRRIDVSFKLASGTFAEGSSAITIKGLRTSVRCAKVGSVPSELSLVIWGLTLSHMNQLSTLGQKYQLIERNLVNVSAGDASAMSTVYIGTIQEAWADASNMPEVPFYIRALAGGADAVISVPPLSYQNGADAASVMSGIAAQMGLTFENSGVNVRLPSSYFPGSLREQAAKCARDGGFKWAEDNGTLAIWPKKGKRGTSIPLINSSSGMIASPAYTQFGVMVRTLYNPSIVLGGLVKIESEVVDKANGTWQVFSLDHDLESEVLDGAWFSTVNATTTGDGLPSPIPR